MKKLVTIISLLICVFTNLNAQDVSIRNRGVIQVEQYFHEWTHCHWDGKPTFGNCVISQISNDDTKITLDTLNNEKRICYITIDSMFTNEQGIAFLDSRKTNVLKLKIEFEADEMDYRKSTSYEMTELRIGQNESNSKENEAKCNAFKHEGYDTHTKVIVDNPIEITETKDNSSLCIDNNDKCEILLNNFYNTSTSNCAIWIKPVSEMFLNDKWYSLNRIVKPKQVLQISYDEILNAIGNADKLSYYKWSGKQFAIKITKKLIDGSDSESNIVICSFVHKGPQFVINAVRRSFCTDTVELQAEVSDNYNLYKDLPINWELKGSNTSRNFTVNNFERLPNTSKYALRIDETGFAKAVNSQESSTWELQLQTNDYDFVEFATNQFTIPPRAPQITISQYTDEGTEEVESGINPYVRIKIEDLDTYYENGRVPYKVYEVYDENKKEEYLTEFNNRIEATEFNEEELKNEFNSQYSKYSWNITEESYKKKRFEEWYDDVKDKNNGLDVRTIISSQKFEIEESSELPALDNVICNGKVLYFYNIQSWGRIMFSTEYPFSVGNQNNKPVIKISEETYYIEESSGKLKKYTANQSVDVQNFGYYENTKFDFLAQSSNSILVCKDNALRIFMFDSNNVWAQTDVYSIQNNFKNPEVYFVSIDGQPYINIKNNGITYCSDDKQLYDATTLYTPNSISEIKMRDGLITYVSNGTTYNQSKGAFSKEDLFLYFKNNRTIIPKTHFDSDWAKFQEERKKEYAKYLAEKLSYKVSGLKHFTEDTTNGDVVTCSGKLKVQEVDSCYSNVIDYKFQYRKVKFNIEVSTYPSTLSANDGVVKLTLDEGGLAPYIVNDSSLNIGDVVEVSGCGYGEKKIMVKDGKGNEFPHSIYIPLPDYEIEPSNQICSERGGKIVLTCKNEALK